MRAHLYSAFLSIAATVPGSSAEPDPSVRWETLAANAHDAFGKADASALSKALDAAATIDLAKALDLAAQHSLDPTIIAGSWRPSPENTESAFHIALKAPFSSYQNHLLLGILHSWVKRDPQNARAIIDALPESPERSNLQENFRQALLRFRPKDALELALTERGTPGTIRLSAAAHALTKADRQASISTLAEIPVADTSSRLQVLGAITKHWATTHPFAAAEWSKTTLTTESEKETAFEEVLYTWSTSAPDSAFTWALALNPGSPRDSALRAFVFRTAHQKPAKAFQAALAITDSHSQETALFTVITEWASHDKHAAKATIEATASLPEELRIRLKTDLDGQAP